MHVLPVDEHSFSFEIADPYLGDNKIAVLFFYYKITKNTVIFFINGIDGFVYERGEEKFGEEGHGLILFLAQSDFQGKIAFVSTSSAFFAVGVLDIQGSVEEHFASLEKLGVKPKLVKTKADLDEVSGLIIPGGESTTIGKLMKATGLDRDIRWRVNSTLQNASHFFDKKRSPAYRGLALWGTCAGAILMAKKIHNKRPDSLDVMDIEITRNAYGGQLDSFQTDLLAPTLGQRPLRAIFIRSPRVKRASPKVKILAHYKGSPVMLVQENLLATMFHPELTNDLRVHQYFIDLIQKYAQ